MTARSNSGCLRPNGLARMPTNQILKFRKTLGLKSSSNRQAPQTLRKKPRGIRRKRRQARKTKAITQRAIAQVTKKNQSRSKRKKNLRSQKNQKNQNPRKKLKKAPKAKTRTEAIHRIPVEAARKRRSLSIRTQKRLQKMALRNPTQSLLHCSKNYSQICFR